MQRWSLRFGTRLAKRGTIAWLPCITEAQLLLSLSMTSLAWYDNFGFGYLRIPIWIGNIWGTLIVVVNSMLYRVAMVPYVIQILEWFLMVASLRVLLWYDHDINFENQFLPLKYYCFSFFWVKYSTKSYLCFGFWSFTLCQTIFLSCSLFFLLPLDFLVPILLIFI